MLRLISALMLAAMLSACGDGGDAPSGEAPAVPGVSDSEILIGSANDLSGPTALLGKAAVNGARMRFEEANAGGGVDCRWIRLSVEDGGAGVAQGERDRIFERFARGSAARHRVGTGLGLALVAEHSAALGGRAWVDDRPGGGARFVVELPVEEPS